MKSVALVLLALLVTITNGAHSHDGMSNKLKATLLLNGQKKESYGYINHIETAIAGRRRRRACSANAYSTGSPSHTLHALRRRTASRSSGQHPVRGHAAGIPRHTRQTYEQCIRTPSSSRTQFYRQHSASCT